MSPPSQSSLRLASLATSLESGDFPVYAPDTLANRDDSPEEPLLLTLTLTVTLHPEATLSALPTFSSASDRSRDAVPTPAPTGTTTSTPMTETPITVVAQEVTSSSDMSTSDVRTTAAIASVVAVLSFAVFSLVLYVLYRAHRRRRLEASRARIECWDREAEACASPESFLDKVLPSHLSGDHPIGGLNDDSVILISPDGPFSAPYHARSLSTISIPPAVQPAGCETVGENIRASTSSSFSQLEARLAELTESIAALKVFGNPRASAIV